ncbi:MAG: hypothetical protein AB7S77_00850 [Desulfatirhabdiaceae bacterium]
MKNRQHGTCTSGSESRNAIVGAIHPISIVLFGSVAVNDAGNDLDMMIVMDENYGSVPETQMAVHRCLASCYRQFAVDPFVVTCDALSRVSSQKSPFLRTIVREGRLVYMKDADREWMRQAQEELDTADYLFRGKYYKGC